MDLTKYKWKCRILLLCTTCYRDNNYKKSKELYQKHIKEFHKRHVKLVSFRKKGLKFSIKLIGFDGTLKKEYSTLEPHNIFDLIDTMSIIQKIIVIPILRSQVRLYIFFGIIYGFYQFISWIEN